ncbi:hypothetical protein DNH61_07805 [Paenibacillus sambharensis]|uniref:Baseplate protein J-like barrel domain-containing protein n=1 Tax=Paenibacillus sambharensis TaxID=1803190 RepID=A0A2W1LB13_9BACL|nr:baseplate J/gp47 family protein [Paenibacillus sambharensis]PZD96406.1 hypothetical protein DNH61_07805 [Paenibacillus sambharensis]
MLDKTGFKRQRFEDIYASMEEKAREVFGDNVKTSERSPLGLILRIFAWILARLWQTAESVYYSGYINTAEGTSLDRLGPFVGVSRLIEQHAVGMVILTGTPGYIVQAGFRLAAGDIYFETVDQVVIQTDGRVKAAIRAVTAGQTGNVAAGIITEIVNPNADVLSVTNPAATNGGREKETDTEFRERFSLSVSAGGAATVDSIRGALLSVPGIRAATVIENASSEVMDGRSPKSFEAYVLGGSPNEIGRAIFSKKAAGIESVGEQVVTVTDLGGNPHEVRFSYAPTIQLEVRVAVAVTSSFPIDGAGRIKTAIIRYIGGEDVDGQVYSGLSMGEDVILSRMTAAVFTVPGVEDVSTELSLDGGETWLQHNIAIERQQVAQADAERIQVNMQ